MLFEFGRGLLRARRFFGSEPVQKKTASKATGSIPPTPTEQKGDSG